MMDINSIALRAALRAILVVMFVILGTTANTAFSSNTYVIVQSICYIFGFTLMTKPFLAYYMSESDKEEE